MRVVLVAGVVKVTAAGYGRLCWLWEVVRVVLAVLNCRWGVYESCAGCGSCAVIYSLILEGV